MKSFLIISPPPTETPPPSNNYVRLTLLTDAQPGDVFNRSGLFPLFKQGQKMKVLELSSQSDFNLTENLNKEQKAAPEKVCPSRRQFKAVFTRQGFSVNVLHSHSVGSFSTSLD